MARVARVVVPGAPHHVIQRGNRRLPTFFHEDDYVAYLEGMAEWCSKFGVEVLAYCLMTNHVHLVAVPSDEAGLSQAIGEAHRRYTLRINRREKWTGHLWQGRFGSYVMDEKHLVAAVRYVELNPVRAQIVKSAEEYAWSSARAHLDGKNDLLVKVEPLLALIPDWQSYLNATKDQVDMAETLALHERTGRPLGDAEYVASLEKLLGRTLAPRKRGRKKIAPRHGRVMGT